MSTGLPGDPPPTWAARSHLRVSTHEELELIRFLRDWLLPAGKTLFSISTMTCFFAGMVIGNADELSGVFVAAVLCLLPLLFFAVLLTSSHVSSRVDKVIERILEREKVIVVMARCSRCGGPTPCRCAVRADKEEDPPEVA